MSAELSFLSSYDFAPGDRRKNAVYPAGLRLHTVTSAEDPCFEVAYQLLESEFGAADEIEPRDVLIQRLKWHPAHPIKGKGQLYRMQLLYVGDECVAVRDHSAMFAGNASDVVVHLSHSFIVPEWRRKGLSGILRALPLQTARECASLAGKEIGRITLLAEMELLDLKDPKNVIRRISYGRANFLAVDETIGYSQPDFRLPEVIEASSKPVSIPFQLLFRRVGREEETSISKQEFCSYIDALYALYSIDCTDFVMNPCLSWLEAFKNNPIQALKLFPPISE